MSLLQENYRYNDQNVISTPNTGQTKESKSKELTINRCKVIINLAPESDDKTIETVKKILLSTYYQDISHKTRKNLAG